MKRIFYGERDCIDYVNQGKYAFMNWRFDNGMGASDKNNKSQAVSDNYQLGKGYLGNALVELYTILENKNQNSVADILIFPIMFSILHGLELWLKGSLLALDIIFEQKGKYKKHDICEYYDKLKKELRKENLNFVLDKSLKDVDNIISELKRVNANFDFARYSFTSRSDYQFYNAPRNDDKQWQKEKDSNEKSQNIVPNTCVDMVSLFELILNTYDSFGTFVECLTYVLEKGETITDEGYRDYLDSIKKTKMLFDDEDDNEDDNGIHILLREIS